MSIYNRAACLIMGTSWKGQSKSKSLNLNCKKSQKPIRLFVRTGLSNTSMLLPRQMDISAGKHS